MAVKFVLNHAGMAALLAALPAPESEAKNVADTAERTAPYSERDANGEHYRDSIETGSYFDDVSKRQTAYVRASVPWASRVEVMHRTLGSALGSKDGAG